MARGRRLEGGVYRVHALDLAEAAEWRREHMVPIPRLLGDDASGRLYIGKAGVFTGRFITLRKALHPGYTSRGSHGFGWAYHASKAVRRRFPRLCFTLRFAADPRAAEAEELRLYRDQFGEPPPFNAMS